MDSTVGLYGYDDGFVGLTCLLRQEISIRLSWRVSLDTYPKNNVISFSQKRFCAWVDYRVSGNTFSIKRPFGQVY